MTTAIATRGAASPEEHLDPGKPHALEHITVVDFTRVLAGPTCSRMLADAGARIIKVERPGTGDDTRQMGPFASDGTSEYYRFANLGKESIALNLKDPDDLALVKSMIAKADVVVENFRPGVMAKLGLDPAQLVREHPRLIVCSISGFGQYGRFTRRRPTTRSSRPSQESWMPPASPTAAPPGSARPYPTSWAASSATAAS